MLDLRPVLWALFLGGLLLGSCAGCAGFYVAKHAEVHVGWHSEAGKGAKP